jgi:Ca2+/Na+ antiporter
MSPVSVWLQFFICVAGIGIAGVYLTRYGDAIADKTGLGGSWVGLVLEAMGAMEPWGQTLNCEAMGSNLEL